MYATSDLLNYWLH